MRSTPGPGPWRALRVLVTIHAIAVFGQPVWAGLYLSADVDMLATHYAGANVVFALGLLQVGSAAFDLWRRRARGWLLVASVVLALAETLQFFAGLEGNLPVHVPLGVLLVATLTLVTFAVWTTPAVDRQELTA